MASRCWIVIRQVKQLLQQQHVRHSFNTTDFSYSKSKRPSGWRRTFGSITSSRHSYNIALGAPVTRTAPILFSCSSNLKVKDRPRTERTRDLQHGITSLYATACGQNVPSKFSIDNPAYASYLNSLVYEFDSAQNGGSSVLGGKSCSQSFQQLSRFNFLRSAVGVIERLKAKHQDMTELASFFQDERDPEMKRMMENELQIYKGDLQEIEEELADVLVGGDPADNSDIMLEVTAGVGGQEAMLFCQEIFTMYCNYAARKGWRLAEPFSDTSEMGGARKASIEISGEGVYRQLKHEGGVHRVQRVPKTEKAGRVHTSTITVSVMPLPKEIDIDVQQKDLKIETFRNSGPGGQSVNTTDSAVRITHIPTGTVAEGKEERSQIKNRDIALKKLKQRMYETILAEQQAQIRASRRLQQGTRARSEKIRTYNFQQDRVTDHRTRESTSNMVQFLAVGGEGLDGLIENLIQMDRYQTLEMMLEEWEERDRVKER